jgi:uncharacterized Zn-binding protein involved in type VI secretion
MPVTVVVNQMTVVHKDSGGMVSFMPDVCLTPAPPGPPVPIPYPNIAMSQDTSKGSKTVSCDGNPIMVQGSCFSKSSGDEAGSVGGVVSAVTKGAAEFIQYSFDVFADGKPVARLGDLMLGNKGGTFNTPPSPEVQSPLVVLPGVIPDDDLQLKPDKLKITLVDGTGKPMKDERYILIKPDGSRVEGKTDSSGKILVEATITGLAKVIFPDRPDATISDLE